MAILPTKNELKEVSLETLTTYREMLDEEITQRKCEAKRKNCEEVMQLLNRAFDLATNYNITLNVFDGNAEIDVNINDGEIHSADYSTIIIDLFP